MEIQIPENIDLSRSEQYILAIEVRQEQFAFSLYHPDEKQEYFYYRIPVEKPEDAFSGFRNAFFDNTFFTLSFKKTIIINYTPVFTYIPNPVFDEKDKEAYLHFLFTDVTGKILCQTLHNPDITILHALPEEIYSFLQRSFTDAQIIHQTAALMAYFQQREAGVTGNRMIIRHQGKEMDVLCFSQNNLVLSNHFGCPQENDAVYYVLYIWKQLKFNQLSDFIYLADENGDLQQKLKKYIRHLIPVEILLSQYEF
jgi:hypothetical protein